MSKTHTPGPWKTTHDGWIYPEAIEQQRESKYLYAVGKAYGVTERAEANAVLIAAAPEMLEALVDLVHLAEVLNSRQHAGLPITPVMWSTLFQRTNEARATIAKAKGEAQ